MREKSWFSLCLDAFTHQVAAHILIKEQLVT